MPAMILWNPKEKMKMKKSEMFDHLTDEQKIAFLHTLSDRLNEGGQILIGDVAFETRKELNQCRRDAGDEWDEDEFYFVAEELRKAFPQLMFEKVSHCAGILRLGRSAGL